MTQPNVHHWPTRRPLPRSKRRSTRRRSIHPSHSSTNIAEVTGPLDSIKGRKVLLLADVENLTGGARDLGSKMSYMALATKIKYQAAACSLHAFFSRNPGEDRRVAYFLNRGWNSYPRDIETVRTHRGLKRESNSDNMILFMAGVLVSRSNAEVVIIGSGDGALVNDLARGLATLPKARQVVTLSLAGSTAQRLNAATHSNITANIEIGRDCLRSMTDMP